MWQVKIFYESKSLVKTCIIYLIIQSNHIQLISRSVGQQNLCLNKHHEMLVIFGATLSIIEMSCGVKLPPVLRHPPQLSLEAPGVSIGRCQDGFLQGGPLVVISWVSSPL